MSERVAVVQWSRGDGTAVEFHDVLMVLGYEPKYFAFDGAIPDGSDYVLTFAPYGSRIQIAAACFGHAEATDNSAP